MGNMRKFIVSRRGDPGGSPFFVSCGYSASVQGEAVPHPYYYYRRRPCLKHGCGLSHMGRRKTCPYIIYPHFCRTPVKNVLVDNEREKGYKLNRGEVE